MTMVNRAIIPAAGFGTRMRPLTQAIPKEMLPLGRKPVLQYVIEELKAANIQNIAFVVSPAKEAIQRYFGDGRDFGVECSYILQPQMRGLGDAILCATDFLDDEPAVIAFGDCVIHAGSDLPLARLLSAYGGGPHSAAVLTQRVSMSNVGNYGIVEPVETEIDKFGQLSPSRSFRLSQIVEKPAGHDAPSNLAVSARWVISPQVLDWLRNTPIDPSGELNLTRAVSRGIAEGASVVSSCLWPDEERLDVGRWETYLPAVIRYAQEALQA